MSDENYQEIDETENTENLDSDLIDLDEFLDGLESGLTCRIQRVEPSEFKGFLEEIDITDKNNPISLDYLKNRWGGHRLYLRFRKSRGQKNAGTWVKHGYVNLYSYPPLVDGKPLKSKFEFNPAFGDVAASSPIPTAGPYPNDKNPLREMMEMANLMQTMRQQELAGLVGLFTKMMPQQTVSQPAFDPFSQATKMLGLIAQMQSIQRPPSQGAGEGDEVLGMLGKLADVFSRTQQRTPAPALTGNPQMPHSPALPEKMTPAHLVNSLQNNFVQLSPEEREQALLMIFGEIRSAGGDDLLWSSLEKIGMVDPEDNDDFEDEHDQNTGRKHGPNEGNDTADR